MGGLEHLRVFIDRIAQLFRRGEFERDLTEEMRLHLNMEIDERVRMGMSPGEARRTALRDFGGVERYKEEARAVRRFTWLEDIVRQTRISARSLGRSPAFTMALIALLVIGVGAAASIYALTEAALLHPVPYRDPGSLLVIWNRKMDSPSERVPLAAPHLAEVASGVEGLESVAFMNRVLDVTLGADRPAHGRLGLVTPGFFELLDVQMARGRPFSPSDVPAAGEEVRELGDVVVLSHPVWRDSFGGDTSILGRTVRIEGRPLTVVGILPESFRMAVPPDVGLPREIDVWAPLAVELGAFRREERLRDRDSDNTGLGFARLAPGTPVATVNERLASLSLALTEADPAYGEADLVLRAMPLSEALIRRVRPLLGLLAAAGGLLLLAICVSGTGLMLARGSSRQRELATRAALGAGRHRLFGELAIESTFLSAAGGGGGLLLAWWATRALRAVDIPGLVRVEDLALTPGALFVAAGTVCLFALVLTGALTVQLLSGQLTARPLPDRLRAAGGARARTVLVGVQLALAFLLLVSGSVLLRRLEELRGASLGFQPAGVTAFDLSLRYAGALQGPADRARYIHRLEAALKELPGVEEVGLVGRLPLSGRSWMQPYGPADTGPEAWDEEANFRVVTSGFFAAAGIRVRSGRGFLPEEDLYEERRVIIVDRSLARRLNPGGDAVGRRIAFPLDGDPVTGRVVGVVEDVRFDDLAGPTRPTLYVPYRQEASREVSIVLRSRGDPTALTGGIRERVGAMGIPLAPYNLRPLEAYVRDQLAPNRLAFDLVALFALLTLLVALAGVYGLAMYSAAQRRKEVAIRMAVGAAPRDILIDFVRWGGLIAAAGLAAGSILLLGIRPLLGAAVAGFQGLDLALAIAAALGLAVMVLSACALGGGAVVRVPPSDALRLDR